MKKAFWIVLLLLCSKAFGEEPGISNPGLDRPKVELGATLGFAGDTKGAGWSGYYDFKAYYFINPQVGIGLVGGVCHGFPADSNVDSKTVINASPQTILYKYVSNGAELVRYSFLGSVKLRLGQEGWDPYVTGGLGIVVSGLYGTSYTSYNVNPFYPTYQQDYPSTQSSIAISLPTNFMAQAGIGMEARLLPGWHLFLESQFAAVFDSGLSSYVPIQLGMNLDL